MNVHLLKFFDKKNVQDIFAGMYYDIHTHRQVAGKNIKAILNRHGDFDSLVPGQWYSLGIHPWHIRQREEQMAQLEAAVIQPGILAVGECGLDRLCATDWTLQQRVFEQQVQLAETLRKPLVVHCVKAIPECLQMLKGVQVPVIFHGFSSSRKKAELVLQAGCYLSFGAALQGNPHAADTFRAVPPELFFLETDDAAAGIEDIYREAASLSGLAVRELQHIIEQNFNQIFQR